MKKHSRMAEMLALACLDRSGIAVGATVDHVVIYALTHQGVVRYIGVTTVGLKNRLIRHFDWARTNRALAIDELIREVGDDLEVAILEWDPAHPRSAETKWIHEYSERGAELVNYSSLPARAEHRAKIAVGNLRAWRDALERRESLAASNRSGKTGMRGRSHSPETKEKIGAASRGKPKGSPSAETRRRMSEAAKRRCARAKEVMSVMKVLLAPHF